MSSYDWKVAVAVRSFALALAGQLKAADGVDAILGHARQANLASAEDRPQPDAADSLQEDRAPVRFDGTLGRVVDEIRSRGNDQARSFAELLALDLAGNFPAVVDSVTVPVVFAGDDRNPTGTGATGKLTLQLLASGPAGLHADPGSMCFLRADEAFADSVRQAWACAPPRLRGACVTWSLRLGTNAAQPAFSINGGSLGGAIAVALSTLTRHTWISRTFQPRNLDAQCAITAVVADLTGALSGVTGLDRKVAAARHARFRLVVAADDLDTAHQTAHGHDVQILGASTVHAATKLARGHLSHRFRSLVATVAVLVLGLGLGGVAMGVSNHRLVEQETAAAQRHAAEQAAAQRLIESEQLADRSGKLLRTDTRLAALTALAAHQASPTQRTTTAMANAVDHNPNGAKVTDIPKAESAAIGRAAVWLSTGRGIVAYSLTTGKPLGEPIPTLDDNGAPEPVALTLSRQENRLVAVGSSTITTYRIDQRQRAIAIAETPRPDEGSNSPDINISPDGRRLLITDDYSRCWLWTIDAKRPTRLEVDFDLPAESQFAIRQVVDENQGNDWTVLVNLETDDRGEILRLDVDKGAFKVVARVPRTDAATDGHFWFIAPAGSGSIVSSKRTGGFSRYDGKRWEQFQDTTSDGVEKIVVSDSGEIAITHRSSIGLLGLSDDTSGDTSVYDVFSSGQDHDFDAIKYVGPHELVAIDGAGELIVIDTAANDNRPVAALEFAVNPDGDGTVTSKADKNIEVSRHSGYSQQSPIGPVVDTYATSVPGLDLRGKLFQADDVIVSRRFLGAVGGLIEDSAPPAGYRWGSDGTPVVALWATGDRGAPLVRDRCDDPKVGSRPFLGISLDDDMLVAADGAVICRWELPSGKRLPDINLAAAARAGTGGGWAVINQMTLGGDDIAVTVQSSDRQARESSSQVYVIGTATGARQEVPGTFQGSALAPDGRSLAVIGAKGDLVLLSVPGFARTRTVDLPGRLSGIAWSPDSAQLAIAQADDTVRLVDPLTGLQTAPTIYESEDRIKGYGGGGNVSWPSTRTVVLDKGFRIKTIDLARRSDWKTHICSIVPDVTEAEWQESVSPSIPFRNPCA